MLYELKIQRKFQYTLYHNRTPLAHFKTKKDAKTALWIIKNKFDTLDKIQKHMKIYTVSYLNNTHLSVYQYCSDFEIKQYLKIEREQIG